MSQKNWLLFLLKMVDVLLDAIRDFLSDNNPPEEKKPTSVGG